MYDKIQYNTISFVQVGREFLHADTAAVNRFFGIRIKNNTLWMIRRETDKTIHALKNGVYELGYSRYDTQMNIRLERVRSLLILLDGRLYSYPYDELGSEYILYTAYSIWVQILGEELAARMFLQREVRDNA